MDLCIYIKRSYQLHTVCNNCFLWNISQTKVCIKDIFFATALFTYNVNHKKIKRFVFFLMELYSGMFFNVVLNYISFGFCVYFGRNLVFYHSLILKFEAQRGQILLLLPLCNRPLKSQSYSFVNVYLSFSITLSAIIWVILTLWQRIVSIFKMHPGPVPWSRICWLAR